MVRQVGAHRRTRWRDGSSETTTQALTGITAKAKNMRESSREGSSSFGELSQALIATATL